VLDYVKIGKTIMAAGAVFVLALGASSLAAEKSGGGGGDNKGGGDTTASDKATKAIEEAKPEEKKSEAECQKIMADPSAHTTAEVAACKK
jgi:hypothetical protein